MARLLQMLPEVEAFERHLIDERRREDGKLRYTPRTAHAYAVAVNKVLHTPTGDFVAALVKAGPVPNWGMIHNAGLAWARWKKDEALTTRLKGIEPPEINYRETRPPTAADWDRIKATIRKLEPEPQCSVLLLLATTGLRIDEVFRLTRRQVELAAINTEIVIMQKGKHKRDWAPSTKDKVLLRTLLTFSNWKVLRDIIDPNSNPTATDRQQYYTAYHLVRKRLQALCTEAGVEYVRPHKYRHAVADDLIQTDGATIIDVQQALGHADSRTTDKFYLHSKAERQVSIKDRAAAKHRDVK